MYLDSIHKTKDSGRNGNGLSPNLICS